MPNSNLILIENSGDKRSGYEMSRIKRSGNERSGIIIVRRQKVGHKTSCRVMLVQNVRNI